MRVRSRWTVSQTGSVSVLIGAPNPSAAIGTETEAEADGSGADEEAAEENGGSGWGLKLAGGGTTGELEMGMDARGGEDGRAGRTAAEEGAAWMRLSISSMSDFPDERWSAMVSPWAWDCDIAASRARAPGLGARSRGRGRDVDESAGGGAPEANEGRRKKKMYATMGSDGTGCRNGDSPTRIGDLAWCLFGMLGYRWPTGRSGHGTAQPALEGLAWPGMACRDQFISE